MSDELDDEVVDAELVEDDDELEDVPPTPDPNWFWVQLSDQMDERGLKQIDVATILGNGDPGNYKGQVSMWCRGVTKPTKRSFDGICKILEWDPNWAREMRDRTPLTKTNYTGKNAAKHRAKTNMDLRNEHARALAEQGDPELMRQLDTTLGGLIKSHRLAKGLSQNDLARLCGFSNSTIGHMERNAREVSLDSVTVVCDELDIDYELLKPYGFDIERGMRLNPGDLELYEDAVHAVGHTLAPANGKVGKGRRSTQRMAQEKYQAEITRLHHRALKGFTEAHAALISKVPESQLDPGTSTQALVQALVALDDAARLMTTLSRPGGRRELDGDPDS